MQAPALIRSRRQAAGEQPFFVHAEVADALDFSEDFCGFFFHVDRLPVISLRFKNPISGEELH